MIEVAEKIIAATTRPTANLPRMTRINADFPIPSAVICEFRGVVCRFVTAALPPEKIRRQKYPPIQYFWPNFL